jgi:hypothetical protein
LFFEKINKVDQPLANLNKMGRKKTQIKKIRKENGEVRTNTKEIQVIIMNYFENLYAN